MVALQLFLALVVLLISDGAQSQGAVPCGDGVEIQCGYKEGGKFCPHLEAAYRKILEAIQLLRNGRYYNDRKGLLSIECTLFLTLLTKGRALALGLTVAALEDEVGVLKQLNATCSKPPIWPFDCFLALIKVSQATVEVVDAIKAIAEGFRPKIVQVVDGAMVEYNVTQERNQSMIEGSIKLGESIATEINTNRLAKPNQNSPES